MSWRNSKIVKTVKYFSNIFNKKYKIEKKKSLQFVSQTVVYVSPFTVLKIEEKCLVFYGFLFEGLIWRVLLLLTFFSYLRILYLTSLCTAQLKSVAKKTSFSSFPMNLVSLAFFNTVIRFIWFSVMLTISVFIL